MSQRQHDAFTEDMAKPIGKADWLYDEELGFHMPCCSKYRFLKNLHRADGTRPVWKCHNGPLTGQQIMTGDCGSVEHLTEEEIDAWMAGHRR